MARKSTKIRTKTMAQLNGVGIEIRVEGDVRVFLYKGNELCRDTDPQAGAENALAILASESRDEDEPDLDSIDFSTTTTEDELEAEKAADEPDAYREVLDDPSEASEEDTDEQTEKEETEPEDDEDKLPGTVVPVEYKKQYAEHDNTCGDIVARVLKDATTKHDGKATALDFQALADIAAANNIDLSKWQSRNNGMMRMNVSNVMRGKIRKGETVTIGVHVFNLGERALDNHDMTPREVLEQLALPTHPQWVQAVEAIRAKAKRQTEKETKKAEAELKKAA